MNSSGYVPSHGQSLRSRPESLHSDTNDGERPRKRVRKGTKSCWECKRRKVKCQLSSEDVPVCSGCLSRGTSCLSQEFPEERDLSGGLQVGERLGRVERLLETLVAKISSYEEEETSQNNILTPESMVLSPHDSHPSNEVHAISDSSPYISLFDNTVIGHRHSQVATPATTTGVRTPSCRATCRMSKTEKIRQALVQLLPSQTDTDSICAASHLSVLLSAMSNAVIAPTEENHFSPFNIAEISKEKPTSIAKTLLYIVVALQQLDPNFDHSRLQIFPSIETRIERILSSVNALVTSDDELVTTMDGIECLLIQGMYFINAGSPRRAWLIFRRALSIGQLMGLQKKTASSVFPNAQNMWHRMVQGDRYLALLLGLPAGSVEDKYEPEENFQNPDIVKHDLFQRKLSSISYKIIERNQAEIAPAYAGTQEIDELLEGLAKEMPLSWWEIPSTEELSDATNQTSAKAFDRLMSQIWYFQLQGLVHLPFMLRAAEERKYDYSRFSCLKSCREVMWRYLAMRNSDNKSFCCKVVDFGALTSTVALFLGLLDPSQNVEHSHQRDSDRALIHGVLKTMESFAQNSNEAIAAQSVNVIKSLLAVDQQTGESSGNLRLTIPYFGTISIVRPTQPQNSKDLTIPIFKGPQSITVGQQETPQAWQGLNVPNHSPVSFPTVSFTSSHFNPMVPEQPATADFGWDEADTLFFDGLLNADLDSSWMYEREWNSI